MHCSDHNGNWHGFIADGEHLLVVQMNKELLVEEGALERLDTSVLSASNGVTTPNELQYSIDKGPALGRLEYTSKPGKKKFF